MPGTIASRFRRLLVRVRKFHEPNILPWLSWLGYGTFDGNPTRQSRFTLMSKDYWGFTGTSNISNLKLSIALLFPDKRSHHVVSLTSLTCCFALPCLPSVVSGSPHPLVSTFVELVQLIDNYCIKLLPLSLIIYQIIVAESPMCCCKTRSTSSTSQSPQVNHQIPMLNLHLTWHGISLFSNLAPCLMTSVANIAVSQSKTSARFCSSQNWGVGTINIQHHKIKQNNAVGKYIGPIYNMCIYCILYVQHLHNWAAFKVQVVTGSLT